MEYPLTGLRVLDMSRVLAGPFAGRMLSDLGAEVVKLEPPEGDVTRLWGKRIEGIAGYFHQQNVGKRGICVDLREPGAAELVLQLASTADVLIENFRPDVMPRLGLGWDELHAANPRLVMLSISGFGHNGPESDRAAYAPIVHAECGVVARQAEFSRAPAADMALSIADTNAALHGLVGLFAALWMRERTGVGQHIDIAMVDAMLITDDHVHYYLDDALDIRPLRSEVWQTRFGPILIAGDFRNVWRQLERKCGLVAACAEDASLDVKIAARRAAAEAWFDALEDRAAFIAEMDRLNLAWGDVRTTQGAFDLPTVQARGTVTKIAYGQTQRPLIQSPYHFSAARSGATAPAPRRGQHNAEVMRDWLRADDAQIERLRANRILHADEVQ